MDKQETAHERLHAGYTNNQASHPPRRRRVPQHDPHTNYIKAGAFSTPSNKPRTSGTEAASWRSGKRTRNLGPGVSSARTGMSPPKDGNTRSRRENVSQFPILATTRRRDQPQARHTPTKTNPRPFGPEYTHTLIYSTLFKRVSRQTETKHHRSTTLLHHHPNTYTTVSSRKTTTSGLD